MYRKVRQSQDCRNTFGDTRVEDAHFEIEQAVISLARAVFSESGQLVFGGHPAISPLVAMVAGEYRDNLRIDDSDVLAALWNVALATAAVGLAAAKDSKPTLAVLAVVPALAFWLLDAYYLALENLYRNLYKRATAAEPSFDMDAGLLKPAGWLRSALRPSVVGLHMPMIVVILLVTLTGLFR